MPRCYGPVRTGSVFQQSLFASDVRQLAFAAGVSAAASAACGSWVAAGPFCSVAVAATGSPWTGFFLKMLNIVHGGSAGAKW